MNESLRVQPSPPLRKIRKAALAGSLAMMMCLGHEAGAGAAAPLAGPCAPVSTLDCNALTVGMPYNLSFTSGVTNSIVDKNGTGTGFTAVNTYSGTRLSADGSVSNASVPGYTPSKITVTGGRLQVVASKGIDFQANNNQINTLSVRVLATQKFQIEVKLLNPVNGADSQQGGIWYGLNDKTFVKLGVTGNRVELRKEFNDVSSTTSGTGNPDQRRTGVISNLNTQTVWLRLVIDAGTNTAEGFYSTNGTTYTSTGAGYGTSGVSISGTGLTAGEQYAGIFSTYRNASAAVTYTYDDFAVTSLASQASASINFRPSGSAAPSGYTADNGLPFDAGRKFGWLTATTSQPSDYSANTRLRTGTGDARQLSLIQMQSNANNTTPGKWEYVVPNGSYRVSVSAGDNNYFDSNHQVNVEGLPAITDFAGSSATKFRVGTALVQVSDGRLTIDATGGTNTKMNYVTFAPATAVTDNTAPTASARFTGSLMSAGVYNGAVRVIMTAADNGGSGLKTFQYALNGGSFTNYTAPFSVSTPGNYSYVIRVVDGNNNTTTTSAFSFSIFAPASPGAYMVLRNLDGFPANDQLTFSRIQIPWRRTSPEVTPYNRNHDVVKLRIQSKGSGSLTVSNLVLSNPSAWKVIAINSDSSAATPVSINPRGSVDVAIRFTALDASTRVKVFHDTLTINSNDGNTPARKVVLHGLYQRMGEGKNEPHAQEIINAFGFTSKTGYGYEDNGNNGNSVMPSSNEVPISYFVRADATKPVTVRQLAAYHGCCAATETFRYFAKGSGTLNAVYAHDPLDGQSLSPRLRNSTQAAIGTFSPAGSFGIRLGTTSSSDRTQNAGGIIGIRFLRAIDMNGNFVPNTYFVNHDYIDNSFTNYDYQDNIYIIENVKPETGTVNYSDLASTTSSAINFNPTLTGANSSSTVTLKNMGTTYSNGSSDPSITIKSVRIVGPNASEFSYTALSTTSLAVQATTPLTVRFAPSSAGIKNAAILVNYNNSKSPLRIPLYGIANSNASTVSVVRRIKSGSNAALTVGGDTYEADNTYRTGSIQLDTQSPPNGVAGTDIDALYQSYLSASTDLAQTGYDIPVSNGNYLVRMHFIENFFTEDGARVFGTTIENQPVLSNFDIFAEAGYRTALVKDFAATVSDGVLTIRYNPSVNRVAIAAIEIFRLVNSGARIAAEPENEIVGESGAMEMAVYPNPAAGGEVYLDLRNFGKNEPVDVSVVNLFGTAVKRQQVATDAEGRARAILYQNEKPAKGIYLIRAQSSSGALTTKLLVE
ncbi:malectin domain-containing carbohydrate-binding protein [Dyadobacter sandarakinus]|uniref:T9SS type A sorting domain-containing protein n=1 Tax=Dyadobacter sandarakinus TaxID=2747268 RepID=A0ABX7I217_9BACT|nr:malectin domain-containing carbohydrate-binding protein [Dyadobacter sandarakinus]QRQ99894.1 T9SS type A sorting domain-containing protein [Dyadobacter sandarakinus]